MSSIWCDLRGHGDVRQALQRAWQRGRLTQAYLFHGPEGVGKYLFARKLAQCLLCRAPHTGELDACGECAGCRPFLAGAHPDFHVVERDAGKRELSVAKLIGDRDERGKAGLCHELSLRPLPGGRKIGVINDADSMNDEAANALLKTLEEPPDGAVLILIAANVDSLLPTIRSRCQPVRFGPLSEADLVALIEQQGLVTNPQEARELAVLAEGSLAVARQLASPELRHLRRRLLGELGLPSWDGMALAKSLAEGLDEVSRETSEQRAAAVWLIRFAVEFYRSALWAVTAPDRDAPPIAEAAQWASTLADVDAAVDRLGALIERCLAGVGQIEQNVSVPLCLEALCCDLSR
jgi:DNA polymerase-3 subunit delta'